MTNLRSWLFYKIHDRRLPIRRRKSRRGPIRLPLYRAWMRQQGCCVCGSTRQVDSAHIGPHGFWQKAPDTSCVPLCRKHHDELHALGRETFEPKHEICFEIIIEGLFTEWSERQARRLGKDVSSVRREPLESATLDAA
jgi:hypothetical protein